MKKILKHFPLVTLAVLPTSSLFVCTLENQDEELCIIKQNTNTNQKYSTRKIDRIQADNFIQDKPPANADDRMADFDVETNYLICKMR